MNFQNKTDEALVNETLNSSERSSVEMMRRLKDAIEKSGEKEEIFSFAFLALAFIQIAIGVYEFIFDITRGEGSGWRGVFWAVLLAVTVVFILRTFIPRNKKIK